jgi:hypothetical protein
MRMPRRIAGIIAGATFGVAVLTATGAQFSAPVATDSTSVVVQDSGSTVQAARTKEERTALRTKEE